MNRNRILSLLMCNMILFSGSSVVFAENSKELSNRNIIKLKEMKKQDSINSISINNDFFNEMTSEYHIVGKIAKVEDKDNGKYILVERNGAPMEVLISEELDIHGGFENIKVGNFIDIRGKESEKGHFIEGEECIVSEKPIGIKAVSAEKIAFREVDNIEYVSLNAYDIKDEQIQKWVSNNKKKSGAHLLEKDDVYFILVSGGECSTGGYSLDIMNVNLSEGNLDITYNVVPPAQDMMVTQAITYPSKILKISKDKEIKEVTIKEMNNIEYVSLNAYDIKDEQIQKWVSNNKKKSGAHLLEKDDAYFILISGGECSTGGYSLDIMNVNLSEGKLDITYKVVAPSQDMMVTQALTYPSKILKISKDEEIKEVNAVEIAICVLPVKKQVEINKDTTLGEIEDAVKNMKNPQEKLNLIEKLIKWVTELF